MPRVAVVGAGYAGCAAAVTLAARGARVTLFEAGAVPGGAARRLPLREALGAMRFLWRMGRGGYRLERDQTVAALLAEHRQNGRAGHYLWRPLCVSALNTPPERASARVFLAVLRDTLAGEPGAADLLLPRVDLSRLFPEPACAFVRAHGGEVRLGEAVRDLAPLRATHDAVIVAVGPHQLKALAPALATEYEYQPIYTCYLQYAEAVKLPLPMLGLAGGLVQWAFDRGALTGEKGRIACVISAQGDHQQLEREALAQLCHRELAAALGSLPEPQWSLVIAEKRATVACTPGLVRPSQTTAIPGVYLAGDYTDPEYPPTLEAAVRSGIRAAHLALNA